MQCTCSSVTRTKSLSSNTMFSPFSPWSAGPLAIWKWLCCHRPKILWALAPFSNPGTYIHICHWPWQSTIWSSPLQLLMHVIISTTPPPSCSIVPFFLICTVSKSVVCWQNPILGIAVVSTSGQEGCTQYFRGSERFVPFYCLNTNFVNISWSKLPADGGPGEKSLDSVFCYWIWPTPWHCELFLLFVMLSFCNALYVLWVVQLLTTTRKGIAEISSIIIIINWFKAEWTIWKLCTFLW